MYAIMHAKTKIRSTTVYACIHGIASILASLPASTPRFGAAGKEGLTRAHLAPLVCRNHVTILQLQLSHQNLGGGGDRGRRINYARSPKCNKTTPTLQHGVIQLLSGLNKQTLHKVSRVASDGPTSL